MASKFCATMHRRGSSKIGDAYAAWLARSEKKWTENRVKIVADFNDHSSRFSEIGRTIRKEGMESGFPAELIPLAGRFAVPSALGVLDLVSKSPRDFSPRGVFKDKVTLLGVSSSAHGREFVSKFVEPIIATDGVDSGAQQVLELSLVDIGPVTWLVKPLILPTIRYSTPEERRAHFLCLFGDSLAVRQGLKIHNRFAGYVFIVDRSGAVVWHASGHRLTDVTEPDVALVRTFLEEATSPSAPAAATSRGKSSHYL
ncbi:hypothetical protein T492DRAFT_1091055 [Pavlovales sp. CCMP2436]|nr:hypothetical protein T492DRAFT_1091055 [Pavlovales sp. CCMP2436]